MLLLKSECSKMIPQSTKAGYAYLYPMIFIIFRLASVVGLMAISGKFVSVQDLSDVNPNLSLVLSLISSSFFLVSILEYHKEIYKVLKYEKYSSIAISICLGIFTEIIWISLMSGKDIFYFHGVRSVPLYFVNYSMFAYTSLILTVEYKAQAYPKTYSLILKLKIIFCVSISAGVLIFTAIFYWLGINSTPTAICEYFLLGANLAYFSLFYYDLKFETFFENKGKECEELYTTTL